MKTLKFQAFNGPPSRTERPYFTFIQAKKADEPVELSIYDQIGRDYWSDSGVGLKDFANQLKEIPKNKEIKVRINSPGGSVSDGMGIYNLLAERRQHVTVVVDGIAASIASVIALCGRSLEMPANTMLMVHDPSGMVMGTADDMRQAAGVLDKFRDTIVAVYEKKTGKKAADLRDMMTAETWLLADEAKTHGFCDTVTDEISFQARFNLAVFNRVPSALKEPAPSGGEVDNKEREHMNKTKIIAALRKRGIQVSDDITDDLLMTLVEKHLSPEAAASASSEDSEPDADDPPVKKKIQKAKKAKAKAIASLRARGIEVEDDITDEALVELVESNPEPRNRIQDPAIPTMQADLNRVKGHLESERRNRISLAVDQCIVEDRIPGGQREKWITRALADEAILDDIRAMEPKPPGAAPAGVLITGESPLDLQRGLLNFRRPVTSWMKGNDVGAQALATAARMMAVELNKPANRARLEGIMNANTIDPDLKRNVILNDLMRAFQRKLIMLSSFTTIYRNVPLEGTDKVAVPYYELDTATSKDFDQTVGYVFDEDTAVGQREITVNKRKYKSMDFSSQTFRRQPYFNPTQSMLMKAEQLAVDIWLDVLSVVKQGTYGASVINVEPGVFDVDDVIEMDRICNNADWPEMGRSFILGTNQKAGLLSDTSLKFFLNAGDTEALRNGSTGRIINFDMLFSPRIPLNGEDLGGFACLPQAILCATAPIAPAPGVRSRLQSYDLVTDPQTGVTFEYRYWGSATLDKDREIVECNYGFDKGNASALKIATNGAATNSSSSSASSVNSSSSSSSST